MPVTSIIMLLLSFLASGHFDYHYVQRTSGFIYFDYSMNFIIYYILILLYMVLISIFFINIGLIVLRKNHNLIVVLFEAFLIYILALITFIIVILKYKNKEKFIIDCEKN